MPVLSKRTRNRLSREKRILEAALKVCARAGYTGASMDLIAAEAGLSKPTLYQYFTSKEALFAAMMRAKRDQMLEALDAPAGEEMVDALYHFAWRYADTVMRTDMLSLARLVIGEAQRLPMIGRSYQEAGPDQLLIGIMRYLDVQRQAGGLVFEDAELAAQDFWGLILSAPRTQALYRPDAAPNRSEIARYVHNGLRVFLRAYAVDRDMALQRLEHVMQSGPPVRSEAPVTSS